MTLLTRRQILTRGLAVGAAAAGAGSLLSSQLAFATAGDGDSRFVFIILRGALDGLTAVPPVGDPAYAALRREIAVPSPGVADGAFRLNGTFGLHPSLSFLAEAWQARQLTVLHAVATPYRERSHFDGQDVLENGYSRAHAAQSGWLNRALAALPPGAASTSGRRRDVGVALGANIPLVMRGPAEVGSWSPSRLSVLGDDTLQRIGDLYAHDPLLARRLADALATDAIAQDAQSSAAAAATADANKMSGTAMASNESSTSEMPQTGDKSESLTQRVERARRQGSAQYGETVKAAAGFLKRPDGPRVAVFDTTGWDTHANEGGGQGQLAARLGALDAGLRVLRDSLGPVWNQTAVLVATEFGRTAAVNGTRGTDHGTGAAAFLLGGAVRGGRMLADWPGLSPAALFEGRDLRPTTDMRSVMKSLLRDHLGVPRIKIETEVFPDSGAARYIDGLV
jgi:uncharacterized protein (DUF1501 family)